MLTTKKSQIKVSPVFYGVLKMHDHRNFSYGTEKSANEEDLLLQRYLPHVKAGSGGRPAQGIYLSTIHNLSLSEFISARKLHCHRQRHCKWDSCKTCSPLIKIANIILQEGICQVSSILRRLFSDQKYQSDKSIT